MKRTWIILMVLSIIIICLSISIEPQLCIEPTEQHKFLQNYAFPIGIIFFIISLGGLILDEPEGETIA